MPIIFKHNLLFIHIPKTGGSSIEDFFGLYHNRDLTHLWHSDTSIIDNVEYAPQHYTPKILREILESSYDDFYKFTFTRNPYSRVLSEYHYEKRLYNEIRNINEWIEPYFSPQDTDHKIPQSNYVDETVNFVGRTESLNEDFKTLLSNQNINTSKTLNKVNSSSNKLGISEISDSNIRFINDLYHDDFIKFNYSKI